MMGLKQQDLADVLQIGKTVIHGAKVLGDCQNGKDSLKSKGRALRILVDTFGMRISDLLVPAAANRKEQKRVALSDGRLTALSEECYTPIWFLAWTYCRSACECITLKNVEQSIATRLRLAVRVERTFELKQRFLAHNDPLRVYFATWEDFEMSRSPSASDEGTLTCSTEDYPWLKGMYHLFPEEAEEHSLYNARADLARQLFQPSEIIEAETRVLDRLAANRELECLEIKFNLAPVFEELEELGMMRLLESD